MNDSRDFKDAESVRNGPSHVPSQPALLPPYCDPVGLLSRSLGMPSRNDRPPDKSTGVFFITFYPGGFNPWIFNVTEHMSRHVTSERKKSDTALDPRCQSGPSARNSFDPNEGRCSNNYGADHQRLKNSDLHFDKFPNPATFACWKMRFKTEICTCSQFPTEAMLWIKEVEMVESVDDLKSSRSIRGTAGPNFEFTRCQNCFSTEQNHPDTRFKKKVSLEEMKAQKEDRYLRGR